MATEYFKFKKFILHQDKCSMKVGTDGVLLGAWVDLDRCQSVLDIGTGTGLISLMIAQRSRDCHIKAIEIELNASTQARSNVGDSEYNQRIEVINMSLQDYHADLEKNKEKNTTKYDLIISNPPFFNNTTSLSPDDARNTARHGLSLSYQDLLSYAGKLLNPNGKIAIIIPTDQKNNVLSILESLALYIQRICKVYPNRIKKSKRILMEITKTKNPIIEEELTLEESRHEYTEEAELLLKDFYLKL